MKLPNGYGSVSKLSGKRRNPYVVRITVGIDEDTGEYVRKVLGYYPKRSAAIEALTAYHKDPYDLSAHRCTFREVYELWSQSYFEKLSDSRTQGYRSAFKALSPLYELPFREIRLAQLQQAFDVSEKSANMKNLMKSLVSLMYAYAVRYEIAAKDYSQFIEVGKPEGTKNPHRPFSPEEIQLLWDNVGKTAFADTVLIMIYTGLRYGELLDMRRENVHLAERYMVGGSKTAAGKNRVIPISEKIFPLIEARMRTAEEYLLEPHRSGEAYSYQFDRLMKKLGMSHRTHDGRHTFASLMDTAGANEKVIKTIMGHTGGDLTSKVYIHKSLPELLQNVDLI